MAPGRKTITATGAPAAIGPYSHAVLADLRSVGSLLFCSGQIPLDPTTGELVGATASEQARQCLQNLTAVCDAAGASLSDAVYASFFDESPPARVAIGVAALPRGAQVEIDAIVALP
jgi:2-iminobutanoate/2-iminopropanoate deaminase